MTRRSLDSAHTAREVRAHFDHHPNLIEARQTGSHRVYRGPRGTVIVPCHNGDLPRGTLRSITRMALMAGLGCLVLLIVILVA